MPIWMCRRNSTQIKSKSPPAPGQVVDVSASHDVLGGDEVRRRESIGRVEAGRYRGVRDGGGHQLSAARVYTDRAQRQTSVLLRIKAEGEEDQEFD